MFDNQIYKEEVFDVQQALTVLKQGGVLLLLHGPRTFFVGNENVVRVASDRAAYQLSHLDFLDLYQNEKFTSVEVEVFDEELMKQKDEEYYLWRHK